MKKPLLAALLLCCTTTLLAQSTVALKKKDRKRDVELLTTHGTITLRLNDSTPLHRDNFLQLVKSGFYDSVLFHRISFTGRSGGVRDVLSAAIRSTTSSPLITSPNTV